MLVEQEREIKERYKEVIDDLLLKYGGTEDRGFEYLKGYARALLFNEEPLYVSDIPFDKDELLKDYKEYLDLAVEAASNKGLI